MKKVLSIILAAMMIFAMLPQCVLAAADTAALDGALGNLADKGQKYVTASLLPATVEIEGTSYDVTYASSDEAVITNEGKVNHGLGVSYVTVTPQISVSGETVKGTAQKLMVMPDGNITLEEYFESDAFKPAEGETEKVFANGSTTIGTWTVEDGTQSDRATYKAIQESESNRYFSVVGKKANSGSRIMKTDTDPSSGLTLPTDGLTILAFRAKMNLKNSAAWIYVRPFGGFTTDSPGKTFKMKKRVDSTGYKETGLVNENGEEQTFPASSEWRDFVIVRKNSDVVDNVVTQLYVDGSLIGTLNGSYHGTNQYRFGMKDGGSVGSSLLIDDIISMNVTVPEFPEIKLGDKGRNYVSGNQLPASVTVNGVECPLSYKTDNPSVISESGAVTHPAIFSYVNVTPVVSILGTKIEGEKQSLLVLPAKYDELLYEDFEGFEEISFAPSETVNGWKASGFVSSNQAIKILSDDSQNKYMHIETTTKGGSGQANAQITGSFKDGKEAKGITLYAVRANVGSAASSDGFNFYPVAKFNNTTVKGGNSSSFTTTKGWHNYLFVVDNGSSENATKKATVYIDGVKATEEFYTNSMKTNIQLIMSRLYIQNAQADDILVVNIGIDDVKIADKGNSYVVGNKLPETTEFAGASCTIKYESSNPAVIDEAGNVTHGESFCYVDVTPIVTYAGTEFTCNTQKLLVMPAKYDEALFEDFENFNEGSLIDGDTSAPNGWELGAANYKDELFDLNIESDKEHGKYFRMEIEKTDASANPVFKKSYDGSENGKTIIAFRANVNSVSADYNVMIDPLVKFASGSMVAGDKTVSKSMYSENAWHDFMFVIDNSLDNAKVDGTKVYKSAEVYVDGVLKNDSYYSYKWSSIIYMTISRQKAQKLLIDDIVVAHIDDAEDYTISNVNESEGVLTGFTVTKNNVNARTAKAYVAVYESDERLSSAKVLDLNFVGNKAVISDADISLSGATSMKIFVWSDALVPVSVAVEKNYN